MAVRPVPGWSHRRPYTACAPAFRSLVAMLQASASFVFVCFVPPLPVLAVVVQEDWSRVVWPSCPSQGWVSGVNRLSSLPNGNTLVPQSKGNTIEVG